MPRRIAHSLRGELRSSLDEVCAPENSRICRYTPCSLNSCSLALFAVPFNPGLNVPHAPLPVSCTEYGIRSPMQRLSRLSRSLNFFFRKVSSTRYLQPLPGACCSCMPRLCLRLEQLFLPLRFYFTSKTGHSQRVYLKVACG